MIARVRACAPRQSVIAARVSGHLKSTDCSDVSKASAPDKEVAPEGPIMFELPKARVCARAHVLLVSESKKRIFIIIIIITMMMVMTIIITTINF